MRKCEIRVDGLLVGVEEFTIEEIKALNNDNDITVTIIKISGAKYNEDYTFTDPVEGSIKEEVAAILEEMENGNIDSLELSIK